MGLVCTHAGVARLQCSWAKAILELHVGCSLKSLKGGRIQGFILGSMVGLLKGDTRSLDYRSCGKFLKLSSYLDPYTIPLVQDA